MRAWICRGYDDIGRLVLEERPRPEPGDGEVLVRIAATTVSSGDMRVRTQKLPRGFGLMGRLVFGFGRPRQPIFGTEFSGVIEAVGVKVANYKPGDRVVGFPGGRMRCHAEYRVMAADSPIAPMPPNLSFEDAAALCFGGTTALHFLRKAALRAGESLLVLGAAGAVGSAMVQIGAHRGAVVTGTTSTGNVALVRSLGAREVIDYTRRTVAEMGGRYDIIADTVAASSYAECLPLLAEHGRYLSIAGGLADLFARKVETKRSIAGPAAERPEDVVELCRLAEAGAFKPVIDRVYRFEEMAEAHARVETGRKRGSVVVAVTDLA